MALGKIKADTLEHSTAGSLDTQFVVNGSAKVWAYRDATTAATILDSFNVSSAVDEGVGDTDYNITNAMSNIFGAFGNGNANSASRRGLFTDYESTSKIRTLSYNSSDSAVDDSVTFINCGDLA
mgnify:CR=1 FL=1